MLDPAANPKNVQFRIVFLHLAETALYNVPRIVLTATMPQALVQELWDDAHDAASANVPRIHPLGRALLQRGVDPPESHEEPDGGFGH